MILPYPSGDESKNFPERACSTLRNGVTDWRGKQIWKSEYEEDSGVISGVAGEGSQPLSPTLPPTLPPPPLDSILLSSTIMCGQAGKVIIGYYEVFWTSSKWMVADDIACEFDVQTIIIYHAPFDQQTDFNDFISPLSL